MKALLCFYIVFFIQQSGQSKTWMSYGEERYTSSRTEHQSPWFVSCCWGTSRTICLSSNPVDRVKVHFKYTVISKSQKSLTLIGVVLITLNLYLRVVMICSLKKCLVPLTRNRKDLSVWERRVKEIVCCRVKVVFLLQAQCGQEGG